MSNENRHWVILAVICLYGMASNFALQSLPPILSLIIEDFNISHAEAGLAMAMCGLPGIFLIIPLSLMVPKIGYKRVGLFSLSLNIAGVVIMTFAGNFPLFLLGRMIIGIGSVALPVVGTQGVAQWFVRRRLGLAMGLYSSVYPLSAVIAMSTFGAIGLLLGWRAVIILVLIINVVSLVLFIFFYQASAEYSKEIKDTPALSVRSLIQIGWPIYLLAMIWGVSSMGNMSISTFMPDFLYQNGLDLRLAGVITSIIMTCALFIGPFIGFISDRLKKREIILIMGAAVACVITFLIPDGIDHIILYVFLLGIFIAPIAPIAFATAPSLVKPEMMALSYGIVATVSYIGMFTGPYVTGLIRDITGTYKESFWFISLFFLLIFILSILLMFRRTGIKKSVQ